MKFFQHNFIFFKPISITGWLLYILLIAFFIYTFIDIDSRSHSVSDTLINFVFNAALAFIGFSGLAFFVSEKAK